jgi:hypothetical protein
MFRECLDLYKSNLGKIFLISITVVFPAVFLYAFVVNYLTFPLDVFFIPVLPHIINLFFTVICFMFIQIPFANMALQYARTGEVKTSKVYGDLLRYGFSIYVVSILFAFLITLGSMLFLLPGLILLILFQSVVVTAVVDDKTGWQGVKQSFAFGKAHFFKLLGWMLLFVLGDFIVSFILSFIAIATTNLTLIANLALAISTALTLSLFVFAVTYQYLDWIQDEPVNDPAEDVGQPVLSNF